MTDGITEDFQLPSEMQGDPAPAIAQLINRLLVVRGIKVQEFRNNQQGSANFGKMEEKLIAEVTFLSGDPISVKLDKVGQVKAQLDPPMRPGIDTRRMIVGGWFKSRSVDRMGNPGWPGLAGVLISQDIGNGQSMWCLADPTPEQQQTLRSWLKWKREQDAAKAAHGAWANQQNAPTPTPAPAPAPQSAPQSAPTPAPTVPAGDPWAAQSASVPPAAKPPWES